MAQLVCFVCVYSLLLTADHASHTDPQGWQCSRASTLDWHGVWQASKVTHGLLSIDYVMQVRAPLLLARVGLPDSRLAELALNLGRAISNSVGLLAILGGRQLVGPGPR